MMITKRYTVNLDPYHQPRVGNRGNIRASLFNGVAMSCAVILAFGMSGSAVAGVPQIEPASTTASISATTAKTYPEITVKTFVQSEVIGRTYEVPLLPDDTLHTVARRHHAGLEEIRIANPALDTWLPDLTQQVTIPASFVLPAALLAASAEIDEAGSSVAVINIPELRIYLNRKGVVTTYPISVGRAGWPTPFMDTRVTQKRVNPTWRPPASIIAAAKEVGEDIAPLYLPGPNNPLGKYAIRLGNSPYLIHGTNKPSGVGLRASHGCIRMYPEHVEVLFGRLLQGDRVVVVDEPIKVGWQDGELYMEVHPAIEESGLTPDQMLQQAMDLAATALLSQTSSTSEGNNRLELDEQMIESLVSSASGIPSGVTKQGDPSVVNSESLVDTGTAGDKESIVDTTDEPVLPKG